MYGNLVRGRTIWPYLAGLAVLMTHGALARGQACTTTTSRGGLSAYAGLPIRSLRITSLDPQPLPGWGHGLARLHASTKESTIRRQLLFTAGDPIDTIKIADSMRRLRTLGFLEDAEIVARYCPDSAGVAVTVLTRDGWSTLPVINVRPSSLQLGVNESNTMGTGRAVRVALQSDVNGVAIGGAVSDPALFDTRYQGQLGTSQYSNGNSSYGIIRPHDPSLADLWTGEVVGAVTDRSARGNFQNTLDVTRLGTLVGRRMTDSAAAAVTYLVIGAEANRADVIWNTTDPVIGPLIVHRRYVAPDFGVFHRTTRFDTLSWVLANNGIADLPSGTEAEIVVGAGRDLFANRTMSHVDAWAGRVWHPGARFLLIGDAWASGYAADRFLEDATARVSLLGVAAASDGLWIGRVGGERLVDPDPTVRTLSTIDPTAPMIPVEARLAEAAVASSLERSFHIHSLTAGTMLDGAFFTAGSVRWDPAPIADERIVGLTVVGAGLRFGPDHLPRSTVRVDLSYPVWREGFIPRRPFLTVSISPWITSGRQRDGSRVQQQSQY